MIICTRRLFCFEVGAASNLLERIIQIRKRERPEARAEEDSFVQPSSALFEKKPPDTTLEQLSQLYDNLAVYADYLARLTAEGLGDNMKYEDTKVFAKTVNQAGLTLLKKSNDIKDEFNNASYCFHKVEKKEQPKERSKVGQPEIAIIPPPNPDIVKLTESVEVDLSENLLLERDNTAKTLPLFRNYTEPYPTSRNQLVPKYSPPSFLKWVQSCQTEREKRKPFWDYKHQQTIHTQATDSVIEATMHKVNPEPTDTGHRRNSTRTNSSGFRIKSQRQVPEVSDASILQNQNRSEPIILPLHESIFPDVSVYKEDTAFHRFRKKIMLSKKSAAREHKTNKQEMLGSKRFNGLEVGQAATVSLTSLKSCHLSD